LPRLTNRQWQFKQQPHLNSKQMKRNEIVRRLREKPSRHLVFDMPGTTNKQTNKQTTNGSRSAQRCELFAFEVAAKGPKTSTQLVNTDRTNSPLEQRAIIGLTSGATNHSFTLFPHN